MAIVSYIQSLNATHFFTLSNVGTAVADDLGNSVDPTRIETGSYSFVADPVCYGVTHCARSTNDTNPSIQGAQLDNRNDINGANGDGNDSSLFDWRQDTINLSLWCRQSEVWNPTVIYEQGGGTNNLAFMGGAQNTFQAADAGQDFLIVASRTLTQAGRAILHSGGWEYRTQHAGSNNRIWYAENGIMQGYSERGGTDQFPAHSGSPTLLNSTDSLRSFNGTTFPSQTVQKDGNLFFIRNNQPVVDVAAGDPIPEYRNLFERTVIPEIVIDSDTVANQQAALNALSGMTFENVNCAIQVRQATDQTNYSLVCDNINFVKNDSLKDISFLFIGTGNLTVINQNGSNAEVVAAPAEIDLDGQGAVLVGGGSISVIENLPLQITGVPDGALVLVYDRDNADPQNLGTELYRETVISGILPNFNYDSNKVGDLVAVKVLNAPTHKTQTTFLNLQPGGTVLPIELELETN